MALEQLDKPNAAASEIFSLKRRKSGDAITNLQGMGVFALPNEFDTKKLASKYVKQDEVDSYKVEQPMPGLEFLEPAWSVWTEPKGKNPHVVASGKQKFVLLCRPLNASRAVEKAYADYSKKLIENDTPTKNAIAQNKAEGMLTGKELGDE